MICASGCDAPPLQQAAEAHRLLESGETHDKIVLSAP
jgi:hypothetical protein